MQTIILRKGGTRIKYRIGKRRAEMFIYRNGDDKNFGDLDTTNLGLTPKEADSDIQFCRTTGFGVETFSEK